MSKSHISNIDEAKEWRLFQKWWNNPEMRKGTASKEQSWEAWKRTANELSQIHHEQYRNNHTGIGTHR